VDVHHRDGRLLDAADFDAETTGSPARAEVRSTPPGHASRPSTLPRSKRGGPVDPVVLLLRLLHIGAAIFWVGSAYSFFLFVQPAVRSLGPDAEGAFMGNFTRVQRFPKVILVAGLVTVLAGLTLYLRDAGGMQLWLGSRVGVGFTIGAIAGIISFALGPLAILPTISKLDAIGSSLAAAHRPPTAEEGSTIQALQARLHRVGQVDLVFLGIAVVFMATARYLG
jgi:uncharacterized membrane protein